MVAMGAMGVAMVMVSSGVVLFNCTVCTEYLIYLNEPPVK